MSKIDLFLNMNDVCFNAIGTYTMTDYTTVNVIFHKVTSDNNSINEEILNNYKHFIEKTIINYVNELDFSGNLEGDVLNFVIDNEELDNFIFKFQNYIN